jgi:hypothetical protein
LEQFGWSRLASFLFSLSATWFTRSWVGWKALFPKRIQITYDVMEIFPLTFNNNLTSHRLGRLRHFIDLSSARGRPTSGSYSANATQRWHQRLSLPWLDHVNGSSLPVFSELVGDSSIGAGRCERYDRFAPSKEVLLEWAGGQFN